MEHGQAIKNLISRGYSFELALEEKRVIRLTDGAGNILEAPTLAEMVLLVMGMSISAVEKARITN